MYFNKLNHSKSSLQVRRRPSERKTENHAPAADLTPMANGRFALAACGLLQTEPAGLGPELQPEGPMSVWTGFMSDDAQTRARSANAVACFSPERVFVERERRERPPRRYDKSGAAASEIR